MTAPTSHAVVWFRRDLRLADNPAWSAATTDHDHVTALFVVDPHLWVSAAEHRIRQLASHLVALDRELSARGGRLHVLAGDPIDVVPRLAGDHGDAPVYVNADFTPYAASRDTEVERHVTMRRFGGVGVHLPGDIMTAGGTPPLVFTPFYRRWSSEEWGLWPPAGDAEIADDQGDGVPDVPGDPLMDGGERAARERLGAFLEVVDNYADIRNRPDLDLTSRLSADLHFGTLDASRTRHEVGEGSPGRAAFVRQIAWRDFHLQVLHHHPHAVDTELRPDYRGMPWRDDPDALRSWQVGRTGFPFVDAGMRQLLAEGWMHNRVRMVVASFLVKDLLIDWRHGERWFRRLLVDGDVAQNVGNWQWVAGTGTDAAPYFRIFNPVSQGEKFDPHGDYVRRWVPELAGIDGSAVQTPWKLGPLELAAADITLGDTYPERIVDRTVSRPRALDAYASTKANAESG